MRARRKRGEPCDTRRMLVPAGKLAPRILTLALLSIACGDRSTSSPEDALRSARLDLAEAIATARRLEPEGRVVEAEFQARGEDSMYEVSVLVGDEVREVMVDPGDGGVVTLIPAESEDLEEARVSAAALEGAKVGLDDAVVMAEREVGGRAHEVEVGDGVIEVRVLSDAGSKIVVIGLAEGAVQGVRDDQAGVEVEGDEEEDDAGEDD
jgi:hypothetical protein